MGLKGVGNKLLQALDTFSVLAWILIKRMWMWDGYLAQGFGMSTHHIGVPGFQYWLCFQFQFPLLYTLKDST